MSTAEDLESHHQLKSEGRGDIDMKEIKKLVEDLMEPNPIHFWSDMLISSAIGWTSLALSLAYPWTSITNILLLFVSSFAHYRALCFNHDLAHVRRKWTPAFSFVWNLLAGIPFFQPTSMYGFSHIEHHAIKLYATKSDPRYVPLGLGTRIAWVIPIFINTWIVPVFLGFRFLIIGPISLIMGGAYRRHVAQHSSTLKMNLAYIRRLPTRKEALTAAIQEITGFLMFSAAITASVLGFLPVKFFGSLFIINGLMMTWFYLRSLCLHRYSLIGEGKFTFSEVILDTVSFNQPNLLVTLLCPAATNYHSLHHLLPTLPYHNMDEAHERLMRALPENHPYVRSFVPRMPDVLADLWERTKMNEVGSAR